MASLSDSENDAESNFIKYIPPVYSRQTIKRSNFQSFCFNIHSVEGLVSRVPNAYDSCYLQAVLYDNLNHRFLGRIWKGSPVILKDDKILVNQTLYFHTPINATELMLVVEIAVLLSDSKNSTSVGWTGISLLETKENYNTVQSPSSSALLRGPVYYGSPAVLMIMEGPLEKQSLLQRVIGATMVFSLRSHPLLMRVLHLIPENTLVGATDIIPGLVYTHKETSKGLDYLHNPQLQKCSTYILEKIAIKITPSLEALENDLVKKLHEGEIVKDSPSHSFNEAVIVQRQLQIGVHNGLCFIQVPDFYHLLVEPVIIQSPNESSKVQGKSTSTDSPRFFRDVCLILRSDVKIPNVPDDPNIMLVFLVEYGISFQNSLPAHLNLTSSFTRSPTSTVAVLWGHCKMSSVREKLSISVPLTSNPSSCPNQTLFFRTSPSHKFELTFYAQIPSNKKEENLTISTTQSSHQDQVDQQSNSIVSEDISATATPIRHPQGHYSGGVHHDSSLVTSHHLADPREKMHTSSFVSHFHSPVADHGEKNAALQEIPIIPLAHMPLLSTVPQVSPRTQQLSRAAYSRLYTAEFPVICDHRGHAPEVINTAVPYTIDIDKEIAFPLQCSEIVLQFLAISCVLAEQMKIPKLVFLTFEFYRFPPVKTERLMLNLVDNDKASPSHSLLHIIHTFQSDGKKLNSPGYQVVYNVDPSELTSGEYASFILYLVSQNLHVDVWDGDSFLYLGTATVPLKYLCRQRKEAVTATLELDIVLSQYSDEPAESNIYVSHALQGNLHLRLTSVKGPLSTKSLAKLEGMKISDPVIITTSENHKQSVVSSPQITKAKPIVETNKELAALMASRLSQYGKEPLNGTSLSAEKRKKLARMEAVRALDSKNQQANSTGKDLRNLLKERQRDLHTIEAYVKKNKHGIILSFLQASITYEASVHPTFGSASYFEFELISPFLCDNIVNISWKCSELSLVTLRNEWKFLRKMVNINEPVEDDLINMKSANNQESPTVFLRAKEKVRIPFKYQCLLDTSTTTEAWQAATGHHFSTDMLSAIPVTNHLRSSIAKVYFSTSEQKIFAVLSLKIQPLPPSTTQVFTFLSPEQSLFKKWIRISKAAEFNGSDLHVKCSDADVICGIQRCQNSEEPVDIYVKVPTGNSGTMRIFYIFIYDDPYFSKPFHTWKITVHAQQRVDLSCVAGQMSRSSLIIRGSHAAHLVKCFSSSPDELQLHPSESFILGACSVQELEMRVRSLLPGTRHLYISMVDQESLSLLRSWLVVMTCQKPTVSKAFQVQLTIGKESTKRITFTNPYVQSKTYLVHCSHPQLLHLRDSQFTILGQQSQSLGLYFIPQYTTILEDVFVYINNTDDRNEETYFIRVQCK